MKKFKESFNINYSDIGENHKLSNTGFLKYLQQIASLHSDKLGYGLKNLSEVGLGWVITNWKLIVEKRPEYGEKILVKTWPRKVDRVCFWRDFEVYNSKNERIAVATSQWIWMNLEKKSIQKIGEEVLKKYKVNEESILPDYKFKRIKEPEQFEYSFEYEIQRRDIDTNHHVNNLHYLDFAYEALPYEEYKNIDFNNVEIAYKRQITLKEKINCLCSKESEGRYIIVIKSENTGETNAIIKLQNGNK